MKTIGVIGSDGQIPKEIEEIAEKIGEKIAKKGFALLCGGRSGVMEAACRGAKKHGGLTIAILPSLDKNQANKHVDVAITTSMGYARNTIVASGPDVLIAVYGSVGTLSEIALAMNYNKHVVLVETPRGVSGEIKKIKLPKEYKRLLHTTKPEDAVDTAERIIRTA